MNINISNLHSTYKLEQRQMAVNTLMRQQTTVKGSIDMFIRSGSTGNDAGVYSPFSKEKTHIYRIYYCWLSIMTALKYENMEKHMK